MAKLARFHAVVARRRHCKAVLDQTLRFCASLTTREAHQPSPPPLLASTTRPLCKPWEHTFGTRVRMLGSALSEGLGGGADNVWGRMKALLTLTPRRSLLFGGMRELQVIRIPHLAC